MAAVDYYLKIEGIKGESQDDQHKDEIDVESFSWGVSQTTVRSGAGGAAAGRAQFQDFHFTMRVNKASPTLFVDCASGQHIKQAVFVGETTNTDRGGGSQFFKYTFSDVLVASYQDGASTGGVSDAGALRFASVKVEATPGARIDISPAAFGNLMLDSNGQPTVVEGQNGLLLSGPVVNADGILIGLSRGISEFSLDDVLGLIGGPQPHLRLVLTVQEVRDVIEQPPVDANLAAATTDIVAAESSTGQKPKKNTLRHNIYWYAPADLELTPDDFGREGRRLGRVQLDPGGDPLQQDFDLTDIVLDGSLDTIGIRIQSAMDHAGPDDEADTDEDAAAVDADAQRPAAPKAAMFVVTLEAVAD